MCVCLDNQLHFLRIWTEIKGFADIIRKQQGVYDNVLNPCVIFWLEKFITIISEILQNIFTSKQSLPYKALLHLL